MFCLPEKPNAYMLWLAAVASGGIVKRWPTSRTRAPPHSKGAQSRFASLSSTAAKRLSNLQKTLHHPTARMQLLDSVYLGLLKLDIVRHRMQKAKTNFNSFSLTNPLGMLSILSSTCDLRFLWFPASHFRGTRGASSQPQPHDRQLMAAQQRTLRRYDTSGALSLYPVIRLYPGGRNL